MHLEYRFQYSYPLLPTLTSRGTLTMAVASPNSIWNVYYILKVFSYPQFNLNLYNPCKYKRKAFLSILHIRNAKSGQTGDSSRQLLTGEAAARTGILGPQSLGPFSEGNFFHMA